MKAVRGNLIKALIFEGIESMTLHRFRTFKASYVAAALCATPIKDRYLYGTLGLAQVVCQLYGLRPCDKSWYGHFYTVTADGVEVEIKILTGKQPRLRWRRTNSEGYLLALWFSPTGEAVEIFNGPAISLLSLEHSNDAVHTGLFFRLSLTDLAETMETLHPENKLRIPDDAEIEITRSCGNRTDSCSVKNAAIAIASTIVPIGLTQQIEISATSRAILVAEIAERLKQEIADDLGINQSNMRRVADLVDTGVLQYVTIKEPQQGEFEPVVVQIKLASTISALIGAIATVIPSLSLFGTILLIGGLITTFSGFKGQITKFEELGSQIAFELYRSTDRGSKELAIPIAHLRANVDQSRLDAKLRLITDQEFNDELNYLRNKGILKVDQMAHTVGWDEIIFKFPHVLK